MLNITIETWNSFKNYSSNYIEVKEVKNIV